MIEVIADALSCFWCLRVGIEHIRAKASKRLMAYT
jgi:hypothetical protein